MIKVGSVKKNNCKLVVNFKTENGVSRCERFYDCEAEPKEGWLYIQKNNPDAACPIEAINLDTVSRWWIERCDV